MCCQKLGNHPSTRTYAGREGGRIGRAREGREKRRKKGMWREKWRRCRGGEWGDGV